MFCLYLLPPSWLNPEIGPYDPHPHTGKDQSKVPVLAEKERKERKKERELEEKDWRKESLKLRKNLPGTTPGPGRGQPGECRCAGPAGGWRTTSSRLVAAPRTAPLQLGDGARTSPGAFILRPDGLRMNWGEVQRRGQPRSRRPRAQGRPGDAALTDCAGPRRDSVMRGMSVGLLSVRSSPSFPFSSECTWGGGRRYEEWGRPETWARRRRMEEEDHIQDACRRGEEGEGKRQELWARRRGRKFRFEVWGKRTRKWKVTGEVRRSVDEEVEDGGRDHCGGGSQRVIGSGGT
eukprot:763792-Hanusia_phi.AAC.5